MPGAVWFRSMPEDLVAACPSGFRRVPISTGSDYYLSLQGFGPDQPAFAHTHPDSEEWVVVLKGSGRALFSENPVDLAPGVVRTDMTLSMPSHEGRTEWTSPREVIDLVLALASGDLDAWSGRMVRAGVDTPESLRERAAAGLDDSARTITLVPWGSDDPLG